MVKRISLVGMTAAILLSTGATAQQGAGVPVGSMQFYPSVRVGIGHDDNLTLTNANEIDSGFALIGPVFSLIGEGDKARAEFTYEGEYVDYWDSSADNYDDHRLFHATDLVFTDRWRAGFNLEYLSKHDGRGSTDLAVSNEPDEWESYGASAKVRYGADSAKGRIEGEVSYVDKEYTNNRAVTVTQDKDDTKGRGTFFWRVGGRTDAILEAIVTDIDYTLATSLQDNTVTTYNAGVQWEATGKTTGSVRLGYTEKDFDSNLVPDYDTFSWDIEVDWNPKTYSTVKLVTSRTIEDSTGVGSSIDKATYGAAWKHNWRDRFSTTLQGGYEDLDYNSSPRQDDYYLMGLRGDYEMRRWLNIGLSWQYRDNDSNLDANDYEQNLFLLELTATL